MYFLSAITLQWKTHLIQQVWVKTFGRYEETRSMDRSGSRFFLGLLLGFLTLIGAAGCHRDPNYAEAASAPSNSGPDPADANMAPVANNQPLPVPAPAPRSAVLGIRAQAKPQQSAAQYPPQ